MTTQIKVDVKKSLGYQENGRLKPEKLENASSNTKQFCCANCGKEFELVKPEFGVKAICPDCAGIMLQVISDD